MVLYNMTSIRTKANMALMISNMFGDRDEINMKVKCIQYIMNGKRWGKFNAEPSLRACKMGYRTEPQILYG